MMLEHKKEHGFLSFYQDFYFVKTYYQVKRRLQANQKDAKQKVVKKMLSFHENIDLRNDSDVDIDIQATDE